MNIFSTVLKLKTGHNFYQKKKSRDNALQNVATILFCAHHLMVLYICIKLYEIIFDNFEIIERTRFLYDFHMKNFKGVYFTKTVGTVTFHSLSVHIV